MHAKEVFVCDHRRTDIKAGAGICRNPILFDADKFKNTFQHFVHGKFRHAQTFRASVHTKDVVARTEHRDFSVGVFIGFHALENFLTVMENDACRVHRDVRKRSDFDLSPFAVDVLHIKHVVGEVFSEPEVFEIGFLLQVFSQSDFHIYTSNFIQKRNKRLRLLRPKPAPKART